MEVTLKWINKDGISGGKFLANLKDGVTYTDNFNEELDSATVILTFQNKIDFEPFDIVELTLPGLGTQTIKSREASRARTAIFSTIPISHSLS